MKLLNRWLPFKRRCKKRSPSCTSNAVATGSTIVAALVSSACLFHIRCLAQAPLHVLGMVAGNGVYPRLLADSARKAGVKKIIAAAFTEETDPTLEQHVDVIEWMRVGQLNRLLKFFRAQNVNHEMIAGQIAQKNLFVLRPGCNALTLFDQLEAPYPESISE